MRAHLGDGRASHVATHALELAALTGFAADGGIDGEAISCGAERFARLQLHRQKLRAPAATQISVVLRRGVDQCRERGEHRVARLPLAAPPIKRAKPVFAELLVQRAPALRNSTNV